MKFSLFSHCSGENVVSQELQKEVSAAIESTKVKVTKGCAPQIRKEILAHLCVSGWSKEFQVSRDSNITITSMKSRCGLCLQTGNVSRVYADLLKLQTLYLENLIQSAVLLVPSAASSKKLGLNIANASRLSAEMEIFRKVIHVPTLIFAFE